MASHGRSSERFAPLGEEKTGPNPQDPRQTWREAKRVRYLAVGCPSVWQLQEPIALMRRMGRATLERIPSDRGIANAQRSRSSCA